MYKHLNKAAFFLLMLAMVAALFGCGSKKANAFTQQDALTSVAVTADEGVFAEGTEVQVSEIDTDTDANMTEIVKKALDGVSGRYTAFDLSAVLNGEKVQPGGEVKVSFPIPSYYSKNLAVYYVSDKGELETISSEVSEDGTQITATLSHFSAYVVADLEVLHTTDAGGNENPTGKTEKKTEVKKETEQKTEQKDTDTPSSSASDSNSSSSNSSSSGSNSSGGSSNSSSSSSSSSSSGSSSSSSSNSTTKRTGKDEWVYNEYATNIWDGGWQNCDSMKVYHPGYNGSLRQDIYDKFVSYTNDFFNGSASASETEQRFLSVKKWNAASSAKDETNPTHFMEAASAGCFTFHSDGSKDDLYNGEADTKWYQYCTIQDGGSWVRYYIEYNEYQDLYRMHFILAKY